MPFSAMEAAVFDDHARRECVVSRVSVWVEPSGGQWVGVVSGGY